MLTYFKMKKNQWKAKASLYGLALQLIGGQQELLRLMQDTHASLKDAPADKLQKEPVAKLAGTIHKENAKGN